MRLIDRSHALKTVLIVLVVSAILALPAYLLYQSAKGLIIDELNKNAINIATTAACFIEEDVDAYKSLPADGSTAPSSFDDDYYRVLLDRFEKIRIESGAARVFTEKRTVGRGQAYLLGGSAGQTSGSKALTREDRRVFEEGVTTASGLMRNTSGGEFITGYAPVLDGRSGKTVGIVGVEFTLTYAQKIMTGFVNIIWICFVVIMLLVSFVIQSLIRGRVKYYKEDYMTGLFNKRFFEKSLGKALR
jgi:hypothetical protein